MKVQFLSWWAKYSGSDRMGVESLNFIIQKYMKNEFPL